jgi:excisionase family DNA binding protein
MVSPRGHAGDGDPEMPPGAQSAPDRPDLRDLDLLTPDDLCVLLKVKKSWIYDEVERGRLEALRLGKQLRFRPSDVARYLDGRAGDGSSAERG